MMAQPANSQVAGSIDSQHFMNAMSHQAVTWVRHRENLTIRPTWKELFNYGVGCCNWLLKNIPKDELFT